MTRLIALILAASLPLAAAAAPPTEDPSPSMSPASAAAFSASVSLIEEDRYCEALPYLEKLAVDQPENADVFSMLGYVHRKMDDLDVSAANYERALALDPNHLDALEYQGELFLQQGDRESALINLSRLETLCGSCEEKRELEAAILGEKAQ
ncbi:MAG: tetratricopeptide repeat protein [Pseudomonadota bacterium]